MGWGNEWVPRSISSLWAYRRHPCVPFQLAVGDRCCPLYKAGPFGHSPHPMPSFCCYSLYMWMVFLTSVWLAECDFSSSHLTSFCPWCLSPQQRASYSGSEQRGRNEQQEPGDLTHFGSSQCHSHMDHFDLISTHCTHLSKHPCK